MARSLLIFFKYLNSLGTAASSCALLASSVGSFKTGTPMPLPKVSLTSSVQRMLSITCIPREKIVSMRSTGVLPPRCIPTIVSPPKISLLHKNAQKDYSAVRFFYGDSSVGLGRQIYSFRSNEPHSNDLLQDHSEISSYSFVEVQYLTNFYYSQEE
jgi:hypothetical protein